MRPRSRRRDPREALLDELRPAIGDDRVLAAIAAVPRDRFVPRALRDRAWENRALPIDDGQTISQPLVVARMCELLDLRGDEVVLDVGTGSGYHAAVLARLAARVVSIERHPALSEQAREHLRAAGCDTVELVVGDGSRGHPPAAPYRAINVAAACPAVPAALTAQLAEGGRMVLPLAGERERLAVLRRTGSTTTRELAEPVRFVPLVCDP